MATMEHMVGRRALEGARRGREEEVTRWVGWEARRESRDASGEKWCLGEGEVLL